jgi:hypothetical protein
MFGFEKNEKDNITDDEMKALKIIGNELLSASLKSISKLQRNGELTEIGGN